MKKLRILHKIFITTKGYIVLGLFFIFIFITAGVIYAVEPDVNSYGDALWYCYVNLFTIGFGDIVPQTFVGRIFSVFLTIYATIVIALTTGIIVAFYQAVVNQKLDNSKEHIIDELVHLDELSKEELRSISQRFKKIIDKN